MLAAVIMLLTLCVPAVGAEEQAETVMRSFYAPTQRKMIDANLAQENFDEEFYHILANACLGDPELLLGSAVSRSLLIN